MSATDTLDQVETNTSDNQDTSGNTEDALNDDNEKGIESGNSSDDSSETDSSSADSKGGDSSDVSKNTIHIGEKDYSIDEVKTIIQNSGKHQGQRDKTEHVLRHIVSQMNQKGFQIDDKYNLVQQNDGAPKISEEELINKTLMEGDPQALKQLLADRDKNLVSKIFTDLNNRSTDKEIVASVAEKFPEIYRKGEDGKVLKDARGNYIVDEDNPLTQDVLSIMTQFPSLNNTKSLPVAVELADNRRFRKDFPNMEQKIKNSTVNKLGQAGANQTSKPSNSGSNEDSYDLMSDEQKSFLSKMGGNSDDVKRISKIMKKAQSNKGGWQ